MLHLLAFANKFTWSDEMLASDRDLVQALGSLESVLEHHSATHRAAGMNSERINRWLFNDPHLPLLLTMAQTGGEVDTDPDFVPFRHYGPLRPLQQRLPPIYRYHANKMWKAGKGLLLRLKLQPWHPCIPAILAILSLNLILRTEGRFIIDASNVSEGWVPLDGTTAKDQAILRYGAVQLSNICGVLARWDAYRQHWNLQWSDLLIFKEDI